MKSTTVQITLLLLLGIIGVANGQREDINIDNGWRFIKGDIENGEQVGIDDSKWEEVTVPHDWAIKGPFDKQIDMQSVAITQNGETKATEKSGRTGALPYIGVGWYRNRVTAPKEWKDKKLLLCFDGAMSQAELFINGTKVGENAYGYSYFYFDISKYINIGEENTIAVRLENLEQSSRWYPGAGLYRKVSLIVKDKVSIERWGVTVRTPYIDRESAKVDVDVAIDGEGTSATVDILNSKGDRVATAKSSELFGDKLSLSLKVDNPDLWSPEAPTVYRAVTTLYRGSTKVDRTETTFGIRELEYRRDEGLFLNGKHIKLKGVCLHHDLGPLGAAVNRSALKRQLLIMKDMGANAIRTAHNMPSIEQLELCDEIGLMVIAESFDEWAKAKCKNGYNRFFEEWAEKDVVNLVKATRNHPSIIMWSAGNEVPDQYGSDGVKRALWLQSIFHTEDPTRPVTVGMDQVKAVMSSGFGALLDIPGLNYRTHLYNEAYDKFPQGFILGSETASTISSRGVYKFPVEEYKMKQYSDYQCSSYDLEACSWSNIPEDDFTLQDDNPWVIGEFVWTGFDYLGEPTPYDTKWPSRSSYFGICDLAGLPKDRFYLYRSRWNESQETLHILPHWNWEGREGEVTPVFVYTNYPKAELFINGVSQGFREKDSESRLDRYRLRWMDTKYMPGEVKVVAYDSSNNIVAEESVTTAGKPHHIKLTADRDTIISNGEDISFITATIVDKRGNVCPTANNQLNFAVKGDGEYVAACNGDATSLEMFHHKTMRTFSGKLVILVSSTEDEGKITLKVTGKSLKSEEITLQSINSHFR